MKKDTAVLCDGDLLVLVMVTQAERAESLASNA